MGIKSFSLLVVPTKHQYLIGNHNFDIGWVGFSIPLLILGLDAMHLPTLGPTLLVTCEQGWPGIGFFLIIIKRHMDIYNEDFTSFLYQ